MTNSGVLSLRCPTCGRPFLSLPQQAGGFVTCPHCAQSAPITSFGSAQASAGAVPMKRRAIRQPDPSLAWGGQQQTSPFAPAASPFTPGTYPNQWPAAPEVPPTFSPPAQPPASFPPPSAFGNWESVTRPPAPQPPPSPFTAGPSTYVPVASMFGVADQSPFQPQSVQPAWQPEPVYAPAYQHAPMPMPIPAQPAPAPLDFAAMRESPAIDSESMETWQPPRQHSYFLPVFFIVLVVGACLWVLRDDLFPPMVVEIPAGGKSEPVKVTTSTPETTTPKAVITPMIPQRSTPEPEPEIRKAEVPKVSVNLVAAGESGQKLFLDLLEASSAEARAKLIDQPEEHSADVEEFFASGKPQLLSFKPSNATPQLLPGQLIAPLFQVTTKENAHGALLRLVPKEDGTFLLDWPLFAETHQRRLAQFLEKKPADPAWYQVGMRRSHGLELPEAERSIQIAFTLQGSADASVSCVAVCQKDTPIGRYLARETDWNIVYLARLLLQHRKLVDGTAAVVILDCEGAATADAK